MITRKHDDYEIINLFLDCKKLQSLGPSDIMIIILIFYQNHYMQIYQIHQICLIQMIFLMIYQYIMMDLIM